MTRRHQVTVPVAIMLALMLGAPAVQAGSPVLRVEANPRGDIEIDARGVTIGQALRAMGSEAGFDVLIDDGIQRRPVNMVMSTAPVEHVLRQLLRGRNYALVYDPDDASLSRVIVLWPPSVRRSVVPKRPFGRR